MRLHPSFREHGALGVLGGRFLFPIRAFSSRKGRRLFERFVVRGDGRQRLYLL